MLTSTTALALWDTPRGKKVRTPDIPALRVLVHSRLADDRRALNLALQDQTAALEWVQANIHFFGGDKSKVIDS
jgi:hypothetical protein